MCKSIMRYFYRMESMSKRLSAVEWEQVQDRLDEHDKKLEQLLEINNELSREVDKLRKMIKNQANINYGKMRVF